MPVRLYDRDDPRYSTWTLSRPSHDGPPLRCATDEDPPLDASHCTLYNPRNYGFAPPPAPAPAPVPTADAGAAAALDDHALPEDGEPKTDAHAAVRRRFWPPWPRRGPRESRKAEATLAE